MNEFDELIIHPHLMQKFLKYDKDYSNLLALYFFYLYQAKLQKTNSILATDNFTKNGIGWGLDKVKRIKRILKKLEVITLTQTSNYSYIQILHIYTQKKTIAILKSISGLFDKKEPKKKEKGLESEASAPKKEQEKSTLATPPLKSETKAVDFVVSKSLFQKTLETNKIDAHKIDFLRTTFKELFIELKFTQPLNQKLLAKWIIYCENSTLSYNKEHLKNWLKLFQTYTSIELEKAIYTSINKKWKNFYLPDSKTSKYLPYLGKDLMLEKHCKNLKDVKFQEGQFVYIFENSTIKSRDKIADMFEKYEYIETKSVAMPFSMTEMLKGCFKRM